MFWLVCGLLFLFFLSTFLLLRFHTTYYVSTRRGHTPTKGVPVYICICTKIRPPAALHSTQFSHTLPPSLPPSDQSTHTSTCTSLSLTLFLVLGRGARGCGGVLARCHFPLLGSAGIGCWGLFFVSSLSSFLLALLLARFGYV